MIGPKFYGFGKDGKPLAFGKLYTYQVRTNVPKDTYQSEDQIVANTNPVILNGEGYANVYLDGSYKVVLKDSDDNEIWSADPVTASEATEWNNCLSATYASSTSFKNAGNFTAEYDVGRKVRIDNNTVNYSYAAILSSVFASGETTVTVDQPVVSTGIIGACTSIIGSDSLVVTPEYIENKDYIAIKSLSDAKSESFNDGDFIRISDRRNALFVQINGVGSADNFGVIANDLGTKSWQIVKDGRMYVEMFGVSQANDIATNTSAYHAAFNFMDGGVIYQENKRYTYSGSYSGKVNLCGDQKPTVNTLRTALENGSILEGSTNFSGNYVYLVNIGVDHGAFAFPSTAADAVKVSALPYNSGRLAVLHGVVGLGRDDTDAFHGILVEGYEQSWVRECVGVRNQFSYAIKSRSVAFEGNRAIEGQNGAIIKSDSGVAGGSATSLNISDFNHQGSANSVHSLRVLSDNAQLQRLNISGVNSSGVDRVLTIEATTAINEVNVSNVNSDNIRKFGIVTSGSIFNVNLSNINMVEIEDYAGQLLAGDNITMSDCYFSLKASSTRVTDALRVESGVAAFTANNVKLVENRDDGIKRGINFANASSQNNLSQVHAILTGNRPTPGFYTEDVDDGLINPIFDGDRNQTTIKLTATGPATITNISTTMPDTTTTFPTGYRLTIMPIGQTTTYTNGANMRMKVAGDQVRTVNQIIEFVWMGSSWHQADSTPA